MKKLLKCRVTLLLLLCWAAFSVTGYLGKDSIYKNYKIDGRTTPFFVLVLDGIRDGVYPWSGGLLGQGGPGQESVAETSCAVSGSGTDESTATGTVVRQESAATGSKTDESTATGSKTDESVASGSKTDESTATGSKTDESAEETVQEDGETEEAETAPAVREFIQVDEDYFDNAVFIGDSRTVGLRDYGGLDEATFYATVGLNVYDMWTEKFCEVDGEKVTLEEALKSRQFGKVYFQIGINEMGRGTVDDFMQEYEQAVEKFKELQPDAVIYVQGIMRVTKEKSDSDAIFNNQGIQLRNERIAELADNRTVFYIDVNEVVCTQYGNLREDLTFDDLHLYGSKYDIWVDFLKTKGIAL